MGFLISLLLFIGEDELGVVLFYLEKIKEIAGIREVSVGLKEITDITNDQTNNEPDKYQIICEGSELKTTNEPSVHQADAGDDDDALKDKRFLHP